jgi:hypothetical protein
VTNTSKVQRAMEHWAKVLVAIGVAIGLANVVVLLLSVR